MGDAEQGSDSGLSPLAVIESVAPEGWKQKLGRVAVQLGIGTRKGAQLYAAGRDQIDTSEGKSIVSKALAEAIAREAVDNPQMLERARARFLGDFIYKQENLEAVMIGAANHLGNDCSPEPLLLTGEAQKAGAPPPTDECDEEVAPLSGDWAAAFTREAEGATSEELRDRLSRVLAGEIRSPGTYPRGVLRLIAELEQRDIEAMQASLPYRIGDAIYHLTTDDSERIDRILKLADAGLAADAAAGLATSFFFKPRNGLLQSWSFGRLYGLLVTKDNEGIESKKFAPLNRAGQAVADLLDPDHEYERQAIVALGKTFEAAASEVALIRKIGNIGGMIQFEIIEYLKKKPA